MSINQPLADNFFVLMIFAANSNPVLFWIHRRTMEKAPLQRRKSPIYHYKCETLTRSSAIAGRPCDVKACQGLLKWMRKWQPTMKWPSSVHQKWHQSKA